MGQLKYGHPHQNKLSWPQAIGFLILIFGGSELLGLAFGLLMTGGK